MRNCMCCIESYSQLLSYDLVMSSQRYSASDVGLEHYFSTSAVQCDSTVTATPHLLFLPCNAMHSAYYAVHKISFHLLLYHCVCHNPVCQNGWTYRHNSFTAWYLSFYALFQKKLAPFLPARRYASAGNRDRNLSVCLSVRLSRAGIVSKRRKLASWFLHHLVAPWFYFSDTKFHHQILKGSPERGPQKR